MRIAKQRRVASCAGDIVSFADARQRWRIGLELAALSARLRRPRNGSGPWDTAAKLGTIRHQKQQAIVRPFNALLLLFLVLLTQVSCSSESEPTFRFVTRDSIPGGKALVYVYRPPSMIGSFGICNLKINEASTGGLAAGQYTYVFVYPGKTRFETTGPFQAFVTVNVEESREYFIKQTWILDLAGYHPRVENIPKLRAERELAECAYVENPPIIEEEVNEPEP